MTLTAAIKFTQGPNTDSPGRAVFGTMTDGPVVCSDGGLGATSRVWTMFDVPPGSAVPTGVFSTSATGTFPQPDAVGGYLVLLTATDGIDTVTTMLDFQIKEASGRMIPPFKASDLALTFGGQTRGYSPTMEAWLRYVDGLKTVHNVRAATTAALPAHTFAGNVMTATANGAFASQDGVALALGDRLLAKDEGSGTSLQNGVYTLTALGSGGAPWSLTRAADFNTDFSVKAGYFGVIEEGAVNGKRGFVLSTANPIVLNTTLLAFQTFAFSALTPPTTPTQDGFSVRASGGNLQYFGGTNGQAVVWVGGQSTFGTVSLAAGSAGISGVLSAANGGTGLSAVGAANTVPISNGTTLAYGLVTDANVATGAAIAVTKLALGAANRVLLSDGATNQFGQITDAFVATGAALAVTKLAAGAANTVLQSNGTTNSFAQIADAQIAASAAVSVTKLAAGAANTVLQSNGTTNSFTQITNAHVAAAAGIVLSKLGQSGSTTGQVPVWNGSAWAPGMVAPFASTYYVDPLFTGTSNGTQNAPYTSIPAVLAIAPPGSNGLIKIATGSNLVGNVTLPAIGNWELQCETLSGATITGNLVLGGTTQNVQTLTNVTVTGTVTGSTSAPVGGSFFVLNRCAIIGAVNLTATGAGFWWVLANGPGVSFFGFSGSFQSAFTIAGELMATNYFFSSTVSITSLNLMVGCRVNGDISLNGGGLSMIQTAVGTPLTVHGPGAISMDGYTYAQSLASITLAGGATRTLVNAVDPSGITQGGAATTNVLAWNGTAWAPAAAGAALTSTAPVDITRATATVGVGVTAARHDHKHDVSVASAVSVGTANAQGSASTLALSDHTHAVTGLLIASQAQGDVLVFNGTAWVRLAASTSGLFLKTQGAAANPVWSTVTVAALSPGATGQALITTGGVAAWGNDFAAQDLTTTGNLLGLGLVQFGTAQTTPALSQADEPANAVIAKLLTVHAQDATGTGATKGGKLLLRSGTGATAGDLELRAGGIQGVLLTATTTVLGVNGKLTTVNSSNGMALQLSGVSQLTFTSPAVANFAQGMLLTTVDNVTNSTTGTAWTVRGQNSTGTTSIGGDLVLASGTGTTRGGNIALHAAAASNQGMAGGLFVGKVGTLPSGDPTNGLYLWSGPGGELTTRSTTPLGGGSGVMRLGDGTTSMSFNIENLSGSASYDFLYGGVPLMSVGVGGTLLHGPVFLGGTFEFGIPRTLATSGTFNLFTIEGQGGFTTGTFTTGSVLLRAGDAGAGGTSAQTGGDVMIRGGFGGVTTTNGNIALGTDATPNWQGGSGIMFLANNTAIPTGNPSGGGFLFPDAGALKWRGSSGTITTIAPA